MFLIPNYVGFVQSSFDLIWTPTPFLSQEEIGVPTIPDPFFCHLPPALFFGPCPLDRVTVSHTDNVQDQFRPVNVYFRVRVSERAGHYARSPCVNQPIRCELLDQLQNGFMFESIAINDDMHSLNKFVSLAFVLVRPEQD